MKKTLIIISLILTLCGSINYLVNHEQNVFDMQYQLFAGEDDIGPTPANIMI